MFVGKKLTDGEKVVIIEDVMTSGKAMAEVYPKLKGAADVDITGMDHHRRPDGACAGGRKVRCAVRL